MPDADILLVEDNPKDAELTLHALRRNGWAGRVAVARDGQEALDAFFDGGEVKPARPRLVLLDLKLPKVPGLEVLRRLKGDERTRAVPVVILTSSTMEGDLAEGYRLGANSYVRKPIDFHEFVEAAKVLATYWLVLNQAPP